MIGGTTFSVSVRSFTNFIISLKPFLPYLTTIPVILALLIVVMKRRRKDALRKNDAVSKN
jgi:hypothetical protein